MSGSTMWRYGSAAAVALAAIPDMGFAQTAAPVAPAADARAEEGGVQDIVVTARKRSESITSVGMSITAINDARLRDLGITGIHDVGRIEPSLKFSNSSYGTPVLTLRGIGFNDVSLAASPAVSIYNDEIPLPFPTLAKGASLDNERLEVLKGPQGTLFGQNATGGAINYLAAKPTDRLSYGGEVTVARFGRFNVNGFISGPLGETVRARFAFETDQGGGWQRSYTRDDSLGDQDLFKFRGLLDWEPSSEIKVRLGVNSWIDHSEGFVPQLQAVILNRPASAPNVQGTINYPLAPRNIRSADWSSELKPKNDSYMIQPFVRAEIALSPSIDLISLTSYIYYHAKDLRSNDGVAVVNNKGLNYGRDESFFQELRLAGTSFESRLKWVLGAQFSDDRSRETLQRYSYESSAAFATNPIQRGITIVGRDHGRTRAAFANGDIALNDQISINVGARYTDFRLKHDGCSQDPDGPLAQLIGTIIGQSISPGQCFTILPDRTAGKFYRSGVDEDNISWRAEFDWKPTPRTLLYLSVSRGYKAGTVPTLGATTYVGQEPVKQESLLAYEAGFKLGLFDRRLQLNGAAFYYDYSDKQLFGRRPDPLGLFGNQIKLLNVPKSRVKGVELSATLVPIEGLTLAAAGTYLNSKVTESFLNFNLYGRPFDFEGSSFPFSPKWSGSASIDYRWAMNANVTAFFGLDGTFQTKTLAAFGGRDPAAQGVPGYIKGDPRQILKGYSLLNGRIGTDIGNSWTVYVFGRNLTGARYWTDLIYQVDTLGRRMGAPRSFGITARFRY